MAKSEIAGAIQHQGGVAELNGGDIRIQDEKLIQEMCFRKK